MQVVEVNTPSSHYAVLVERGLVRQVAHHASQAGLRPTAVAVIADGAIEATYGAAVQRSFEEAGVRVVRLSLRASEEDKTLATVQDLCQQMLEAGLDRRSMVAAVGGGVVGDVAGFAASVFMRGIACVQVPTTLLAMVDASIGGKTGVNLARQDGTLSKNMVGSFWQPRAVICDPEVLGTLDGRELRCGLAECVKHAVIGDASLLGWIEANRDPLLAHDPAALGELVSRNARIKAAIVGRDEREDGPRALLNLGHSFAHAIEALDHAGVTHGEAVAIGLVAASRLAAALGDSGAARETGVARVLATLGLPIALPRPLPVDALMLAMRSDKKNVGGALRLVVPYGLGDVRVVDGVSPALVQSAWRVVGAR